MSAQIPSDPVPASADMDQDEPRPSAPQRPWFLPRIAGFFKLCVDLILGKPEKSVFTELYEHLRCEESGKVGCRPMTQSEAYIVEIRLLDRMKTLQLVAKIQALRQSLFDMLPQPDYEDLMRQISLAKPKRGNGDDLLKMEARALLDRVYRRYVLVPKVEQIRSRISWNMLKLVSVASVILIAGLFAGLLIRPSFASYASIAFAGSLVAGSVGATVSTLIRFQKIDPRRDPLMVWLSLYRDKTLQWLSPLLGALFGLIMFLLMRSEMLSGTMFPDFTAEHWRQGWLSVNMESCETQQGCGKMHSDFSRLFVWCFIAGWAERFVPDVLNRLAKHAHTQMSTPIGPAGDADN
ncbi:hypothetical protein [Stenotrophomonas sp. PS02289]|uniref:hypothetical protein n=1 Tax=Stenotrophomonas sp. PS02289 TaxID=2991422 RepID=UPI00249B48FC|nr:hypothetical protein [Stenotrophomonas sp. PS02289]